MTSNACNITNNWREVLEKCDGQKVVIFYFDLHHDALFRSFTLFSGGVKP